MDEESEAASQPGAASDSSPSPGSPAVPVYDRIGHGYQRKRRPEPTWQNAIVESLGASQSVVNIGAGSGSYEPADRAVVAVDPAIVMLNQRAIGAAPAVRAIAESLPFANDSFDAALAVLTVHHWADAEAGLAEMRRVSQRQVVVTWDPIVGGQASWFARDYMPELLEQEVGLATLHTVEANLGDRPRTVPLFVPANCQDGFFGAYWRRPAAYLDVEVRSAMSAFALMDQFVVDRAISQLARDLDDGTWMRRHQDLMQVDSVDLGYRLVTCS